MSSPDHLIMLKAVNRWFDVGGVRQYIIKACNHAFASGESHAILGQSGVGKTTLLSMIAALSEPNSGQIVHWGASVKGLADADKARWRNQHIGFIYQMHHLMHGFSVLENVAMPLLLAGKSIDYAQHEAMSWIERVGLEAKADALIYQLSSGQRQRIALARACVTQPRLLCADEPTGSLDQGNSHAMIDLLLQLQQTYQMTLIIVTHDQHIASRMDCQYELVDGQLQR